MTDPSQLAAEAAAISASSTRIKAFAKDAAANIVAQHARLAALEARLAWMPPVPVKALMFSDEFDAPLDPARWDVKSRIANQSKTIFTPASVSIHDSVLDFAAWKDDAGQWFGGEIQLLAAHAYTGPRYMETCAQVPAGAGTWSAPLWEVDAPWGSQGIENDVCEQLGIEPTKYHVTVHNGPGESFGKVVDTGVDLSLAPHVYGCAMYADHADYYFDGRYMLSITAAESKLSAWRFTTTPMVCLVDLDMGGWGGAPTIAGPVHMLDDGVRVWAL